MKTKTNLKKALSLLLCIVMALPLLSGGIATNVYAAGCTHVHTEECLSCENAEHTHTDECHEVQLICEQEEHTHTEACYQAVLSCAANEHIHTAECYDAENNLICEMAEHTHSDECYTPELICEKAEHTHSDECYETQLICEQQEHTHTEGCYLNCQHVCGEECGVVAEAKGENARNSVRGTLGASTDMLIGDYMYLEEFKVTKILDGTGPFDVSTDPDAPDYYGRPGNDAANNNGVVRSFDMVSYDISYKVEKSGEYDYVENGYLCFEFALPAAESEMYFDLGNMGWMGDEVSDLSTIPARASGYTRTITESSTIIRGKKYLEPSDGNSYALPGIGTLNVIVCVGAAKNGTTLQPVFKGWMEHNDTDNTICPVHHREEVKSFTADPVSVTAEMRLNVQVKKGLNTQVLKTWDFTTGNDKALDKSAGTVKGRATCYGITLQLYNDNGNRGLRGCEIPSGDINVDVNMSSAFLPSGGTEVNVDDDYAPLVWAYGENITYANTLTRKEGRSASAFDQFYARGAAPANNAGPEVNTPEGTYNCYNGGNWEATKSGNTVSFTVSDYVINPNSFPNCNTYETPSIYTSYYNPLTGVENIGCFSAGVLWIVQPFENSEGDSILEDAAIMQGKTEGDFYTTISDSNLRATSASGTPLAVVSDTSNQSVDGTDDSTRDQINMSKPGSYNNFIQYSSTGEHGRDWNGVGQAEPGTCAINGEDQATIGSSSRIAFGAFVYTYGDRDNAPAALNALMKFDTNAFILDPSTASGCHSSFDTNHEFSIFYAAKPDGSKWTNDAEMNTMGFEDLLYYPTLTALEDDVKICVGVLAELRPQNNDVTTIKERGNFYLEPNIQVTVKDDAALLGNVYQVTSCCEVWSIKDFPTDGVPSLANNNPESPTVLPDSTSRKNDPSGYIKAQYSDGAYTGGHVGQRNSGDSLYIVPYKASITKSVEQHKLGTTDLMSVYDLDFDQRYVDYVLYPSARSVNQNTDGLMTTLTIVDTLPKGLEYQPGTATLGGTYKQAIKRDSNGNPKLDENREEQVLLGRRGTVTGGESFEPITGTDENGNTTLTWIIYDVEVDHWGEPLRYGCKISKAAAHNQDFFNSVAITATHDKRAPGTSQGNYATEQIKVSKLKAVSMSKEPLKIYNDIGEDASWVFMAGNNAANPIYDTVVMDALPYDGDAYGSHFDADLVVKSLVIQNLNGEGHISNPDEWAVWYTTDTDARGTGSSDYNYDEILDVDGGHTSGGVIWTKGSIDWTTGEVDIPHDQVLTAIIFTGTLKGVETLKAHIYCNVKEATNPLKQNDILTNSLWQDADGPDSATVYYVSRALEGCTWLDADKNGVRLGEEDMLSGVTATLYKLKDGGTATNEADYEIVLDANGNPVTVQTGKQTDVISGVQDDYATGRYQFNTLVAGTYGVKFTDGTANISQYTASPVDVGENDDKDSDAAPTYNETSGTLEKTVILGIVMETASDGMRGISQVSRNNDSGLYSEAKSLTISKTVTGNLGDRDKLFTFTITLKNAGGNNISDTFTCVGGIIENSGATAPTQTQITFTNGSATIQLKHGQTLTIQGLPNHCQYTVAETAAAGYTKTVVGSESNTNMQENATVAYTNRANITSPTGILLEIWPYALVVLLAIGGAVIFIAVRKKKKRDANRYNENEQW